ncbi:hypothetical protein MY5147_000167 [Beauveria neobassiana]
MLGTEDRLRLADQEDEVDDDDGQYAEESPLLRIPGQTWPSDEESRPDAYSRPGGASPTVFKVTVAVSVIILISDVVASVPMTPRLVIFEDILCRNYYDAWGGSGDSRLGDCKVEPVQAELAVINGVLVSIPYGALANHIGRTNVLVLALFGSLLSECWLAIVCWLPQKLPLRALWFSGVFQLIGGGGATVMAMCYTMIADMCTPQQSSVSILAATLVVVLLFFGRYFSASPSEYEAICGGKDHHDDGNVSSNPIIESVAATNLQKPASASTSVNAASYLLPLRAGINLVVLFWVIPHLVRFFTKQRGLVQWQADKYVTLISGVCLAVGSVLIFLSSNPLGLVLGQTFIALGFSFTVTARSFLTAMVEPRFMSLLYSGVTSVTYAGLIVGGPVFSTALKWGLKLGGIWIGLPFLVAAVLFTVATLTTLAATVTG